MPLYEYACKQCELDFEELVPLADYQKPQPCPECGEPSDRIVSVPNVGTFSAMSEENKKASLMKRSRDHTAKTVKKDGIPQFRKNRNKDRWAHVTTTTPDKK